MSNTAEPMEVLGRRVVLVTPSDLVVGLCRDCVFDKNDRLDCEENMLHATCGKGYYMLEDEYFKARLKGTV